MILEKLNEADWPRIAAGLKVEGARLFRPLVRRSRLAADCGRVESHELKKALKRGIFQGSRLAADCGRVESGNISLRALYEGLEADWPRIAAGLKDLDHLVRLITDV